MNIYSIKSINFHKKTIFNSCCFTKNLKSHLGKVSIIALSIFGATLAFTYFRKQRSTLITFSKYLTNLSPKYITDIFSKLNTPIEKNELPSHWRQRISPSTTMEIIKKPQTPTTFLSYHTWFVTDFYTQLFKGNLLHQFYSMLFKGKNSKMMGRVNWISENFGLWMPGVALVVAYLKDKYHFKEFHVCETLEGFSKKLEKFTTDSGAKRGVFIVPCFGSDYWVREGAQGFKPNFPQHKVAVVVEKEESGLVKLALLDAEPRKDNAKVSPENVKGFNIWDNWQSGELDFNPQELVFRAVMKANLPQNTQLFHSGVIRQTQFGCASFAIKDGVAFLRDPFFFEKITVEKDTAHLDKFTLKKITTLPPAFMVGTQSAKALQTYMQNNKKNGLIVKEKNGHSKTLSDYIEKHHVIVGIEDEGHFSKEKQNHYITLKVCRYNEIVLQMLTKMTQSEINQCLSETLVE
jgi:hypothetical protein